MAKAFDASIDNLASDDMTVDKVLQMQGVGPGKPALRQHERVLGDMAAQVLLCI